MPRIENEDGSTTEVVNTEFWHMPYRKNSGGARRPRSQNNNNFSGGQRGRKENWSKGAAKRNAKGKSSRHQNGGQFSPSKPSKPRRAADSPFAALAALKTQKKGD